MNHKDFDQISNIDDFVDVGGQQPIPQTFFFAVLCFLFKTDENKDSTNRSSSLQNVAFF